MPTISKKKAVQTLANAIKAARPDDLAEIYNELFPQAPTTVEAVIQEKAAVLAKINAHIDRGLEIDEILGLWRVIFTQQRCSYDDEKRKFHYEEAVWAE